MEELNTKGLNVESKVIIDSIRNDEEVMALKQHYPNFYLISVYADSDLRFKRLEKDKIYKNKKDFIKDDDRDSKETFSFGQQVKKCNYLADVVLENGKDFMTGVELETII